MNTTKTQSNALENKVIGLEKQTQNQQQEIKKMRKSVLCICIVLALCQATLGYHIYYGQCKVSLALAKSELKRGQADLLEAQINLIESKGLKKIIEFLAKDAEFQKFIQEDPDFLDSIQEDLKEAQGMLEDKER